MLGLRHGPAHLVPQGKVRTVFIQLALEVGFGALDPEGKGLEKTVSEAGHGRIICKDGAHMQGGRKMHIHTPWHKPVPRSKSSPQCNRTSDSFGRGSGLAWFQDFIHSKESSPERLNEVTEREGGRQ